MQNAPFIALVLLVLLPLFANALYDAFTGLLFRPLTNDAGVIAIFGAVVLCWCNYLSLATILFAFLTSAGVFALLKTMSFVLSSRRPKYRASTHEYAEGQALGTGGAILGAGDFRLIAVTSYLCSLQHPVSAITALWLAGLLMLLLFAISSLATFITTKRKMEKNIGNNIGKRQNMPEEQNTTHTNLNSAPFSPCQANYPASLSTSTPSKTSCYGSKSAPMGLAIVTGAAVSIFSSIPQT